jgi:hypothetical protein
MASARSRAAHERIESPMSDASPEHKRKPGGHQSTYQARAPPQRPSRTGREIRRDQKCFGFATEGLLRHDYRYRRFAKYPLAGTAEELFRARRATNHDQIRQTSLCGSNQFNERFTRSHLIVRMQVVKLWAFRQRLESSTYLLHDIFQRVWRSQRMRQPLKCIERLDYMNDLKRSATPLGYDCRRSHRCFSTDSEIMANDKPVSAVPYESLLWRFYSSKGKLRSWRGFLPKC